MWMEQPRLRRTDSATKGFVIYSPSGCFSNHSCNFFKARPRCEMAFFLAPSISAYLCEQLC